jgi:hypothetical protein
MVGLSVRERWERITPKFMALSSFRKAFVGLSLVAIPAFIAVGYAVQAPNMVTGVTGAISWFTVAAVNATLFFWAWEEITELKISHRRWAMVVLGIITIWLFHRGVNWAMVISQEAAEASEVKEAREGYTWAEQYRFFHQRPMSCAAPAGSISKRAKPDLLIRLVWKKEISVLMVAKNALVRSPQYSMAIWDLENPGPQMLPAQYTNTFNDSWIKPGHGLGPMPYIRLPSIAAVVKPGDRLFGFIVGTCPECERTRAYWIYVKNGEGGWFAELPKGQYPDVTKIFKDIEIIKKNPEWYLSPVPKATRVPIEDMP